MAEHWATLFFDSHVEFGYVVVDDPYALYFGDGAALYGTGECRIQRFPNQNNYQRARDIHHYVELCLKKAVNTFRYSKQVAELDARAGRTPTEKDMLILRKLKASVDYWKEQLVAAVAAVEENLPEFEKQKKAAQLANAPRIAAWEQAQAELAQKRKEELANLEV